MIGAMYGDILGSCYEVRCTKNYNFDLFQPFATFTDDSVLTAAVCEAILENGREIGFLGLRRRALEFAAQYKKYYSRYPEAGYGYMFSRWAGGFSSKAVRSYGNGAAMRAVPFGYAYKDINQIKLQVKASCLFTHRNKEAICAAQAVAVAVRLALDGAEKSEIKARLESLFGYDLSVKLDDIREDYVFDPRAGYSVPPAIIAFLESEDYESAVRLAVSLGGDADTMACIAGGIAEAYYKEIPENIRSFCQSRLDLPLRKTAEEFEKKYGF